MSFANNPEQVPIVGQNRSLATRRKIIEAAAVIFSKEGFKGSSTRSIAESAGVMNSIISYHFGSKKKLWVEVIAYLFQEFRAVGETCIFHSGAGVEEQFREHLYKLTEYIARKPDLFRIILSEAARGESLLELIKPQIEEFTNFTRIYFMEAQKHGICTHLPLEDFHAIFQGGLVTRFVYGYETKITTGVDADDIRIIRSHADSMMKLFLGKP